MLKKKLSKLSSFKLFLPYDVYERHRKVGGFIKENESVIDVGGELNHLSQFCHAKKIVVANLASGDVIIKKDRLPFGKNSFDVVCAIDVLEHIPKKERKDFIKRLVNVASERTILSFPIGTKKHIQYEKEIQNWLLKSSRNIKYLQEHTKFGLPSISDITMFTKDQNCHVFYSGNITINKYLFILFILSDGSVPLTLASRNVLHFQVPFNFPPVSLRTKVKLTRYGWIVTNSNFTKSYIDKSFGVDSKVIYPPVDVKRIKLGKKEKIILSVGRFSKLQLHPKKQEVLIEVFKEIYKKVPSWKLVLVGQSKKDDYKYVHSLKKTARGYGIKIFENLPVDKLRNLYSQTSIYWHATGF